jgi:hypothetical protein
MLLAGDARAEDVRIDSFAVRSTAMVQDGHGYQSQAGPRRGPGSERLNVFQPQLEVRARQGKNLRHRLWIPVDVVTSASANAADRERPDVVSTASQKNVAEAFDYTASYKTGHGAEVAARVGGHLEENFRSWRAGSTLAFELDDAVTVVSFGVLGSFDYFDGYDFTGQRAGRRRRSTTTLTTGITQILSPTTIVNLNYGVTAQNGTLGNTWNVVPVSDGTLGEERLPPARARHAWTARLAQYLPWRGALRGAYRLYADDWGAVAHTGEAVLAQRLSSAAFIEVSYRRHFQTGVDFFGDARLATLRTMDSDLARFTGETWGIRAHLRWAYAPEAPTRSLDFEILLERYTRSNDLSLIMGGWLIGWRS